MWFAWLSCFQMVVGKTESWAFWIVIHHFVLLRADLMSEQAPRGYRPLAPRTRLLGGSGDGGEGTGSPAGGSAPEEKRMRRASTACTECQKRRTRVHIHCAFYFPLTSLPFISPNLVLQSIWHTLFYYFVSVPALLIAPNVQPTPANVSSMKPPTDAVRPPPRESRTSWTISGHLWTISSGSSEIVTARRCN